jgi:hypothetical protein
MDDDYKNSIVIPAIVSSVIASSSADREYIAEGRCPNQSSADYDAVVQKIKRMKVNNIALFTRT